VMDTHDLLHRMNFPANARKIRAGDAGDCAYVIQSGVVDIVRVVGGKENVIASLGAGEIFGEMALIDGKPRMADAITGSEATLLVVPAYQLAEKMRGADPFLRALLRMFVENLRVMTRNALVSKNRTEALIAALRAAGLDIPPEDPTAYDIPPTARG
jgi:CRP/FNR family transcriptional regulator, cyclic AMP receptor protein